MITERRTIAGHEATLRDENDSEDLSTHRGTWFTFGPRDVDEVMTVVELEIILSAPQLLAHFEALAGERLEIDFLQADRFGHTHPLTRTTLVALEEAGDFRAGEHDTTMVEPAAYTQPDGSPRAGLRGVTSMFAPTPLPPQATWTSAPVRLRGGTQVERVSWEIDDLRDASGAPRRAYKLACRGGTAGTAGQLAWGPWHVASEDATDFRNQEHVFAAGGPRGTHLQWRVILDRPTAGDPRAMHTATVFTLGAWVTLASLPWAFDRLVDLALRSTPDRLLRPNGWAGEDLAVLRVPTGLTLYGRRKESVRARLVAPGGQLGRALIRAHGEVWHEDRS